MGGDSTVNQSSLLGLAAGGDKEVHDEHKSWTSKYTEHYETGIVIHVTSGTVQHANLNLSEVHATANLLTLHLDKTPLQVHLNQAIAGIQVHIEPDSRIRKYHWHGGHLANVVNLFETDAHEIKLTATEDPATNAKGTMALQSVGEMILKSTESIRLWGGPDNNLSTLRLGDPDGSALISSKQSTTVNSPTRTVVAGGGNSSISLTKDSLELKSGDTFVSLSPGKLVTSGTDTRLDGKVTIGQPAIAGMATRANVSESGYDSRKLNKTLRDEITALQARLAAYR
jgi:hypothetical protein